MGSSSDANRADNAVCEGCFLYEHRGVCPMARDAYGVQNSADAERRAERFRAAIVQEAGTRSSLAELVAGEVAQRHVPRQLSLFTSSGLGPPEAGRISTDSRKEVFHVASPRTSQ
jgi:hypothetical protein